MAVGIKKRANYIRTKPYEPAPIVINELYPKNLHLVKFNKPLKCGFIVGKNMF